MIASSNCTKLGSAARKRPDERVSVVANTPSEPRSPSHDVNAGFSSTTNVGMNQPI